MAARAGVALVVAALLALGCDISQNKPETSSERVSPAASAVHQTPAAPVLPRSVVENPAEQRGNAVVESGEKSIRLFGPGVSRKRQTRV